MRWLGTLTLVLLLGGAASAVAAEKWALLVGINEYQNGGGEWDLRGCENDVRLTRQLLVHRFGFAEDHIKVLLDDQATAQQIVRAIEDWLIARPGPQDMVYFHFSGHGSQISDTDGDEEDGRDEVLCPSDMRLGDPSTLIVDDQLKALLERIPARHLTAVIDACHSGTGTRDMQLSRPRFIPFEPGDTGERKRALGKDPAPGTRAAIEGGGKARITISGCRSDQTAADAWIGEGFYAGALTYHLVQTLQQSREVLTYGEALARVTRDLAGTFQQVPQLEGDSNLPFFGTGAASPPAPSFAVVETVQGDQVVLKVGRFGGVRAGSVFALYTTTETRFEDEGLGQLEILQVEETRSTGRLLTQIEVRPGFRAREVLHQVADPRLRVRLEGGDETLRQEVAEQLEGMAFVELVAEGGHFDRRVRLARLAEVVEGVVLFDGSEDAAVVGRDAGELAAKLQPCLANAYLLKRLSCLDNPLASFGVAVWVDQGGPDQQEKFVRTRIGETVRFHFRAQQDCHLTLLNVGTSGQVTVLFPNPYHPGSAIKGGKVYSTETQDEMPFVIRVAGPPGRELVKAIDTLQPLDWPSLGAEGSGGRGLRSVAGSKPFADQLVRDMAAVYTAAPQQSTAPLLPTVGWSTDYLIVESAP